jgi:hypothetical protein
MENTKKILFDGQIRKVHTYIHRIPQCMSPRRNWDPPPSPASECAPYPRKQKGGGAQGEGEGVGSPIPTTGEKA